MKKFLLAICFFGVLAVFLQFAAQKDSPRGVKGAQNLTQSLFQKAFAGFGITDLNIFQNYGSWTNSTALKTNDTYAQVFFLQPNNTAQPLVLLDMNGDGLADAVYNFNANNSVSKTAIFLNNGSGFDLVYKCYVNEGVSPYRYYGDCAG